MIANYVGQLGPTRFSFAVVLHPLQVSIHLKCAFTAGEER